MRPRCPMVQGKLVAGQSGRPEAVEMKKLKFKHTLGKTARILAVSSFVLAAVVFRV